MRIGVPTTAHKGSARPLPKVDRARLDICARRFAWRAGGIVESQRQRSVVDDRRRARRPVAAALPR